MMTVQEDAGLKLGEPVTIHELEARLDVFEAEHRLSTAEFLVRFENGLDDLEDIEDADIWYQTKSFLDHLCRERDRELPPWLRQGADEADEGPKGSLFVSAGLMYTTLDARTIYRGRERIRAVPR